MKGTSWTWTWIGMGTIICLFLSLWFMLKPSPPREPYRLLHLVLYSETDQYKAMYKMLSRYYRETFPDIKTVFYTFSPHLESPYSLSGDVLYIRGKDTYIPGILDKTWLAMKYFQESLRQNQYNYIVRSNISTIVNFKTLIPLLETTDFIDYGGGMLNELEWIDPHGGVTDDRWFGTVYGSGTALFLSKNLALDLLNHPNLLRRDLVDDLAIGVFFREYRPSIVPKATDIEKFCFVPYFENRETREGELRHLAEQSFAFYRNHNGDRNIDVEQMHILLSYLSQGAGGRARTMN